MLIAATKRQLRAIRAQGRLVGLISLCAKLWYLAKSCRDYFYWGEVRRALTTEAIDETPEALVSFVMDRFRGAIAPIQNRWEITELLKRLQKRRPKTVLEIGTARGGTLFLLCRSAADGAHIVSLDLPSGRNGGGFPAWKEPVYGLFAKPGQRLDFIRGDSHAPSSMAKVKRLFGARSIDFLLIDGDHSYEGVKADFELYSPLVSPDGLIAFHDITENKTDPEIDVHRFWNELRNRHKTEELVESIGIGLVAPHG